MKRGRNKGISQAIALAAVSGLILSLGWGFAQAGRSEEARVAVSKADVELNIATALKLYELDNGAYPTTEEGLAALQSAVPSAKNWKGPYLEKEPVDPWGNNYTYRSPGTHKKDYDLYSLGKDGIESADDVTNWSAAK